MLLEPPDHQPPHPQKSADGWPPVAAKNLRNSGPPQDLLKQKSRRLAASRRSGDGTCEKPLTDAASLPRTLVTRQQRKEAGRLRPLQLHPWR
jgi:hypothetical protein